MSKINDLIQELCPNGVEYLSLEKVTSAINIGINPRKFFKLNPDDATGFYVTVRELNGLQGVKQYEKTDTINDEAIKIIMNRANIEKGDLLFSNTGTVGKMAMVTEIPKNWGVNEGIYVIKPLYSLVNSKYLYYYLSGKEAYYQYSKKFTGSTLKHVTQKALLSIQIPVPPLEIQREIVRILDNFTELTAELTAELTVRKKQYEYYRDKLLNADTEISKVKVKDIAKVVRGKRVVKSDLTDTGLYPVYQNAISPMGYYSHKNRNGGSTYLISAGAAGAIGFSERDFWAADDCFTFECSDNIQNKYLYYVLLNNQLLINTKVRKASIPRISKESIENLKIPLPPIAVQNRLVKVLDNFDTICSDLNIGLPAEIEARKKQYEYYRDMLLTFVETGGIIRHTMMIG